MPDYRKNVKTASPSIDFDIDLETGNGKFTTAHKFKMAFPNMTHNGNPIRIDFSTCKEYPVEEFESDGTCEKFCAWDVYEKVNGKWSKTPLPEDAVITSKSGKSYNIGKEFEPYADDMYSQLDDAKYVQSYAEFEDVNAKLAYLATLPELSEKGKAPSFDNWKAEYFDEELQNKTKIGFAAACDEAKRYAKNGGVLVGKIKTPEQIDATYGNEIREGNRLFEAEWLEDETTSSPSSEDEVSLGS